MFLQEQMSCKALNRINSNKEERMKKISLIICGVLLMGKSVLADNLFETVSLGIHSGYTWFVVTDKELGRVKQCLAKLTKQASVPGKPECSQWLEILGGK